MYPLVIIFQQSLAQGIFPLFWKRAYIVSLYKGKGNRTVAASYRPLNLCSCLGKLLEKIVKQQLEEQINNIRPLSSSQHGFRVGRSTLTNLLACDPFLADLVNKNEPFDINSFDFKSAFDKVPHALPMEALRGLHLHYTSLQLITSFLTDRSQQVVLSKEVSSISVVLSGVVQGAVLGPTFFTVFIDSPLCKLSHLIPKQLLTFADDLNLSTGVDDDSSNLAQEAVAIVYEWSESHKMALSTGKNFVLHYGAKNPKRQYKLGSSIMPTVLQFKDLGVLRSEWRPYGERIEIFSASCQGWQLC